MCRKRSNGNRLPAREARKHCACARIQVWKTCRFYFAPGWAPRGHGGLRGLLFASFRRKRSKGSRLSAREARKHCACARIQA